MGDDGACALGEALKSNASLLELDLSYNNYVGDVGARALGGVGGVGLGGVGLGGVGVGLLGTDCKLDVTEVRR